MIFDSFEALVRTFIVGTISYILLIALLRVSGKRTLAKWNAFDFIVTIAFGSLLATMLLSQDTSLVQGVFGFALLVLLQYVLSWLSTHYAEVRGLIKSQPTLLLYQGEFRHPTLRKQRVTEGEIRTAIRNRGIAAIEDVEAVVLETDGSFSVLRRFEASSTSALSDVEGYPEQPTADTTPSSVGQHASEGAPGGR
jgi:uncharacterized membrane protein YcaP (DUF421 family)